MNGLKDFSKIVNNYKALIVLIIAGKVLISIAFPQVVKSPRSVSYTHLDVYKRQLWIFTNSVNLLTLETLETFASEMINRTQFYNNLPENRRRIIKMLLNVVGACIEDNHLQVAMKFLNYIDNTKIPDTDLYDRVLIKYHKALYSYKAVSYTHLLFNLCLKYLCTIPLAVIFLMTTHPSQFASSLNQIGIPYKIAYSVSLTLRYIPDLQEEFYLIKMSQEARGLELSSKAKLSQRIKGNLQIIIPLIFSSLEPVSYTHLDVYKRQSKNLVVFFIFISSLRFVYAFIVACLFL